MPVEAVLSEEHLPQIASRAERTLEIMHRWGYAPQLDVLASHLLGGSVPGAELDRALRESRRSVRVDGFACLAGREDLVERSRGRVAQDRVLNGRARTLAQEFARDLARNCPFVECIALSGSVASGAYDPRDDIDFDLFVRRDTKYTVYLVAQLVGLRYSWRYRHQELDEVHRLPFLSKIICVNVVWPSDQTRPFVRQDADLAFELLRCRPLYGARRFREALDENPWLAGFFPQIYDRLYLDAPAAGTGILGRVLAAVAREPRLLDLVERICRRLSWIMYRSAQASRSRNPRAVARMEFLRRVKYPYEVFQD